MNGRKRKAKKQAQKETKRRRDLIQEQILSKARPFIETKATDDGPESLDLEASVSSQEVPRKPPKRQKQSKAKKSPKGATPRVALEEQKQRALDYLRAWHGKEEDWKFSKKRQIWLVRNMYLEKEVSNEDFSIMLEYLDTLTGSSRDQVVTKAKEVFKNCEATMDELGNGVPESCKVSYRRARQILQTL